VLAGGSARGNSGAASGAISDINVGLDSGIAARIDDLAGADGGDLRGHVLLIS